VAILKISRNEFILLFVFVLLDNVTTYYGVFHLNLEEGNPVGRFIFEKFGKYGIFLTFLYEFFASLGLFVFYRFLREKVFKVELRAEYIAIFAPLVASINNIILILLNH
jgi:hypothetical protein